MAFGRDRPYAWNPLPMQYSIIRSAPGAVVIPAGSQADQLPKSSSTLQEIPSLDIGFITGGIALDQLAPYLL